MLENMLQALSNILTLNLKAASRALPMSAQEGKCNSFQTNFHFIYFWMKQFFSGDLDLEKKIPLASD